MYLLAYKGHCASVIINGIKFTSKQATANIDDDKAHLFVDKNGNSYYPELQVIKIEKKDVVPEDIKKTAPVDDIDPDGKPDYIDLEDPEEPEELEDPEDPEELEDPEEPESPEDTTLEFDSIVASLKKKHSLSELQKLCEAQELSTTGSKTELATRLANEVIKQG